MAQADCSFAHVRSVPNPEKSNINKSGCGSKAGTKNGTLASGNKGQNLRNPCLIWSHTHIGEGRRHTGHGLFGTVSHTKRLAGRVDGLLQRGVGRSIAWGGATRVDRLLVGVSKVS